MKQTEATMKQGGQALELRTAVITVAAIFVVTFVLLNLILDWVASVGLAIFMGFLSGILASEIDS